MREPGSSDGQWLLALDTSTDWAGVALTDGQAMVELNWCAGRRQTSQVMPEVRRLLGTAGLEASALAAVGVAIGPGSFSGLRVAVAIANGISVATGIPVIGVSTLVLTVHGWADVTGPVVGVIKAGRSRYGWASSQDASVAKSGTIADLVADARSWEARAVVGELSDSDAVRMRELTDAVVPPAPARLRRAGTLASIAWERWSSGEFTPSAVLEPIYLHRS